MKKRLLIVNFLLLISFCSFSQFSQWTRVTQLPSSDIASLYHKDSILYAGGKNIIYISRDKGQTWDSTNNIPQLSSVDNIIVHKNELYASSYSKAVYKSADGGITWQNISSGIFPFVSDFSEYKGDLYASTLGASVYKLDAVDRNHWVNFSNGLSSLSANINSIAGNNNALIAGTIGNGLYDRLASNSTTWDELFLLNHVSPTEGVYDIVTAQDSLFLSGRTGRMYLSTDNGLNWNTFGPFNSALNTTMVNARQALLLSRYIFDGLQFNSIFYYFKKDSLSQLPVLFSFVQDHFSYKLDILGGRIWDASNKGLFYMPLSALPGISAADEQVVTTLPLHFTLLNASCLGDKVSINWRTAQEQNLDRFEIEKTVDGIDWNVIGNVRATGNTTNGSNYSFTDNDPQQNAIYRIAQYDLDRRVQYSDIISSPCNVNDSFSLWPNPVHDRLFIKIVSHTESPATIRLFDSKGSLVEIKTVTVLPGINQFTMDTRSLPAAVYSLSVNWNNGQAKKTVQVLKR